MTTTTPSAPYYWIKHLFPELAELNSSPLFGYPAEFPWKELQAELAKYFELDQLQVEASIPEWRLEKDLYDGLGSRITKVDGVVSPLQGGWRWVIAQQDLNILLHSILTKQSSPSALPDGLGGFEAGIHHFILMEVINAIARLEFDPELLIRIKTDGEETAASQAQEALDADTPLEAKEVPAFHGPALALDITIGIGGQKVLGRVLLSQELQRSIKEHYSIKQATSPLSSELAQKLMATIHLEAAKTTLTLKEWSTVSIGDMLLLDKFSSKGRIMLTVNGRPLFRGKIKQGIIKILESPLYYEVEEMMANNNEHEESAQDPDINEGENFETEGFDDEISEGQPEFGDAEIEEEHDAEEEVEESEDATPQEVKRKEPLTAVDELPLTVVVEVGRLKMSVQKLLELQPGQQLEVDANPESGVDLVVNDRLVGRGELILIGESLGVRILDLAGK